MSKIYLAGFITLITSLCSAQTNYKTLVNDFQRLSGHWSGSLTYLDYSSGKPYTMPADIEIKRIGGTSQFSFSNIYPNEMSANSIDTITLSTNGKSINNERVIARRKLADGAIEIITEEAGTDGNDNKPATFRHTYTVGKTSFKKRKDVRFTGETEWINRHEYSYTKKPGP